MKKAGYFFSSQTMAAIVLSIILVVSMMLPISAVTVTVTTTQDEDDGSLGGGTGVSLREAIKYSNAGDVIDATGVTGIITLTGGELTINKDLIIQGPGANVLAISGNNISRIFSISGTSTNVTLQGFKITEGRQVSATATNRGAGIYIISADNVIIDGCTIDLSKVGSSTNAAYAFGGGIAAFSTNYLKISGCIIADNQVEHNYSTFSISHVRGGGIYVDGSVDEVIIEKSAILNNDCLASGNGQGTGGGLYSASSLTTVVNSTVSGNTTTRSGAAGVQIAGGVFTMNFCTVSNNSGTHPTQLGTGGIICNQPSGSITNSIISGNTGTARNDINGTIGYMATTIVGDSDGLTVTTDGGGNQLDADPGLDALQLVDGTYVHPIDLASLAIDAANCGTVTTDQRGISRPQGSACDIGAFELEQAPANLPPVAMCQDVTVSAVFNCEADASIDNGSYDPDGDPITITQDPPGPYSVGITSVTLTVDDGLATSQCTANVTVVDDTPPVPNVATLPDAVGECSVTLTPPTATDNCAGTLAATTGDPLTYTEAGSFMVTWTYDDGNGNSALQSQNVIVNGGAGTISGTVTVNGNALAGVKVALLDTLGVQLAGFDTLITDSYGNYLFSDVPPDTYLVRLIEPLGYTAAENPIIDTLDCGEADMVDFALEQAVVGNNSKPAVWWDLQYFANIYNFCNPYESEQDLLNYIDEVHQHYTPHFDIFEDDVSLVDWWKNLRVWNNFTTYKLARRQLAALVMNLVSGRIGQYTVVSADGRTAGEVLTYVSQLLTDNNYGNDIIAERLARKVNRRRFIAAGQVPSSSILYKGGDGQAIDWGFDENLPREYTLDQNYPNPFNPSTTISFALPEASRVSLTIYNVQGQRVRTLASGNYEAGIYNFQWDATNDYGVRVSSGVYFYRIQAENYVETRKMMLLR